MGVIRAVIVVIIVEVGDSAAAKEGKGDNNDTGQPLENKVAMPGEEGSDDVPGVFPLEIHAVELRLFNWVVVVD